MERCKLGKKEIIVASIFILKRVKKMKEEEKILKLIKIKEGLYYNDISEILNIDLEEVVKICTKLENKGKIESF